LLALHRSADLVVGIDFGITHIRVAVADRAHELIAERSKRVDPDERAATHIKMAQGSSTPHWTAQQPTVIKWPASAWDCLDRSTGRQATSATRRSSELGAAGDLVLDPMRDALHRGAIRSAGQDVTLSQSTLGERAEVLGAVALALTRLGHALER
jgi:predicted NBD/HSP70 family sugar kinase